jgi:hypothetical protein
MHTLAYRRAKADISRGGSSLCRGMFLLLRVQGTTTYRIVESTDAVYNAGGTSAVSAHRARTSNVVTIGTATAHGLTAGKVVQVSGMSGAGYNGTFEVISAPDTTHFTYANVGENEGEIADTGGATLLCPYVTWTGTCVAAATETYDRVFLAGSLGAYAINDIVTMQNIVAGDVSAPVVDPTDDDTCVLGWAALTPAAFSAAQKANPQLVMAE